MSAPGALELLFGLSGIIVPCAMCCSTGFGLNMILYHRACWIEVLMLCAVRCCSQNIHDTCLAVVRRCLQELSNLWRVTAHSSVDTLSKVYW